MKAKLEAMKTFQKLQENMGLDISMGVFQRFWPQWIRICIMILQGVLIVECEVIGSIASIVVTILA